MTTLCDILTDLEGGEQIEYIDTFRNKWEQLRYDDSNVEDMKRLIIFVCNLLIDIVTEKDTETAKILETDLEDFSDIVKDINTVEELEKVAELHIYDVLAILSKI